MKCYSLKGATLLLPMEAIAATSGQYLALGKAWRFCLCLQSCFRVTSCHTLGWQQI